jgi:predicted metalloprotease
MLEFGRITTKKMNFLEEGDIDEALSAAHAVGVMQFRLKFKDILFQNPLHTSAQRKHGLWAINPETNQGDTFAEIR